MKKGFLATLFAAAVSFAGIQSAFALAPVISGLPDIYIGDAEAADNPGGTDNNLFIFKNAFLFSSKVSDGDTADASLIWSFGEFDVGGSSIPVPQYQVNGIGSVNTGTGGIGVPNTIIGDEAAGSPAAKSPGVKKINIASPSENGNNADYASFRDVFYSPTAGSVPFPEMPNPNDADAAAGRLVRFYVADPEQNLASKTVLIKTLDDGFDDLSGGWTPLVSVDTGFSGWVVSGIDSGPEYSLDPTTPDDVDYTSTTNELSSIVRSGLGTGRSRILGWKHPSIIPYSSVGTQNYVRAKYYVYTNNAGGDAVNRVPNFRIRLQNIDAVVTTNDVNHATTGNNGPATPGQLIAFYPATDSPITETSSGIDLMPSRSAANPSLYRLDFDPIDVPALAGTDIAVLLESFAMVDPANATISLTECEVGVYDKDSIGAGTVLSNYTGSATGFDLTGGKFNAQNNFVAGRRQEVYIGAPFDTSTGPFGTFNTAGMNIDSANTPTDRFGVAITDLKRTGNTNRARVSEGKLYKARFHAKSTVNTSATLSSTVLQGLLRFRMQSAAAVWNCRLEINSAQSAGAGDQTKTISTQALPGVGSLNPDVDGTETPANDGGWYTVLMNSPLDQDIRKDTAGASILAKMPRLAAEPGPGVNADSFRDIILGVDGIHNPSTLIVTQAGASFPFATNPQNASVTIGKLILTEHDQVDDGGY